MKDFYYLYYFMHNHNLIKYCNVNINNKYNVNDIYKKNFLNKKYYFNIKLNTYLIGYLIRLNRSFILSKLEINSNLFYSHIFNKNFISFFFDFNFKKNNFLVLDTNYSYVYPLYKYIFGLNSLHLYKNFFFLKPVFFTNKSWSYFFLKFCKFNKINLLFISDFNYYSNFYKSLIEFDCSVSAIVPFNYVDPFVDYPLYSSFINNFTKITYFSILSQIFFYSFNNINIFYKLKYLNTFYKYSSVKILNI